MLHVCVYLFSKTHSPFRKFKDIWGVRNKIYFANYVFFFKEKGIASINQNNPFLISLFLFSSVYFFPSHLFLCLLITDILGLFLNI